MKSENSFFQLLQSNRFQQVLKIVVFLLLTLFLYFQLKDIPWKSLFFVQIENPFFILISFSLIPLNLFFEWLKWKKAMEKHQNDSSSLKVSFFSGILSSFFTPNGWGGFIGRSFGAKKKQIPYIIFISTVSNFSQLIPTLFFGTFGLFFTHFPISLKLFYLICLLSALGIYFFIERFNFLYKLTKKKQRILRMFRIFRVLFSKIRIHLLCFSFLRYLVFSIQFALLFLSFKNIEIIYLLSQIAILYLFTAFIPSFLSGKIVLRETLALYLFGVSVFSAGQILLACILIWLFNIVLPAFFSFFYILFSKKQVACS